jgi:hypothetical protein
MILQSNEKLGYARSIPTTQGKTNERSLITPRQETEIKRRFHKEMLPGQFSADKDDRSSFGKIVGRAVSLFAAFSLVRD